MSETAATGSVAAQFPALTRLSWQRRTRVPYVQQLQFADCGAACLAMVLAYHGREVRLEEVREAIGVDRDGADALSILRACESYGLRGRGVKLTTDELDKLPVATILHWEFNHFVVFERCTKRGVEIVDPAYGRRLVPLDKFRRSFTGVAILLEPNADFEVGKIGGGRVWSYLRQLLDQRALLVRVVLISVLLRLFALGLPVLTAVIVDRVVPRHDLRLLWVVGLGLGAALLFHVLSQLIRAHFLLQLRTSLDTRMTLGFLAHLVSLPYAFFQRRSAGDLMLRVNSNTTIREMLTSSTLSALLDGTLVGIYLLLIFLMAPGLGVLVLILGALQVTIFIVARGRYRDLMARDLEAQSRARSYLVQIVSGIETLKASGAEDRAVERWSNFFVDELNVSLTRGRLAALVESFMSLLQVGSPLAVLAYGATMVVSGQLSLGAMLAINALAVGFLTPLSSLVTSALQLQELGSYVDRIDDVLSTESEQQDDKVMRAPPLSGRITVDGVSFRYGARSPLVVRDASVEIEAGSCVAIVGRSGSGKSTMASLLLGLYRPSEGGILYDGHDLTDLDVRSVRRQLGIVPQAPYIFAMSLRENIALAAGVDDDATIEAAARIAHIHADIAAMPMGYDTVVSDGGMSLSGGQRQRVALARALVNDPAVLLLDEATSALDTSTELEIMRSLDRLRCTRVVIAHRLSTIADADKILVMDGGRIVESGRHDELVARSGAYAELVAAQIDLERRRRGHA